MHVIDLRKDLFRNPRSQSVTIHTFEFIERAFEGQGHLWDITQKRLEHLQKIIGENNISSIYHEELRQTILLSLIGELAIATPNAFPPVNGALYAGRHDMFRPVISAILFQQGAEHVVHQSRKELIPLYNDYRETMQILDMFFVDVANYCCYMAYPSTPQPSSTSPHNAILEQSVRRLDMGWWQVFTEK